MGVDYLLTMTGRDEIIQQIEQELKEVHRQLDEIARSQRRLERTAKRGFRSPNRRPGRPRSGVRQSRRNEETAEQERRATPNRPMNALLPINQNKSSFDNIRIDLIDHGDEFLVAAGLSGFHRGEIDIQLIGQTLRIKATPKNDSKETEDEMYLRRERYQPMARSLSLPATIIEDEVTASMEDGVLTVKLPKTDPSEPILHIDIE